MLRQPLCWVGAVVAMTNSVGASTFLILMMAMAIDQTSMKGKVDMDTNWIRDFCISFVAGIMSSQAVAA